MKSVPFHPSTNPFLRPISQSPQQNHHKLKHPDHLGPHRQICWILNDSYRYIIIYIHTHHIYIYIHTVSIYIYIYTHIDLPGLNPHQPNIFLFNRVQVTWPSPRFPAPPRRSPPGASHRPRAFQRSTPSSHGANARYGWSPHTPHPRWDPRQVPDIVAEMIIRIMGSQFEHLQESTGFYHVLPILECPANCPIQFWKTDENSPITTLWMVFEPSQPGGNGVTHSHGVTPPGSYAKSTVRH